MRSRIFIGGRHVLLARDGAFLYAASLNAREVSLEIDLPGRSGRRWRGIFEDVEGKSLQMVLERCSVSLATDHEADNQDCLQSQRATSDRHHRATENFSSFDHSSGNPCHGVVRAAIHISSESPCPQPTHLGSQLIWRRWSQGSTRPSRCVPSIGPWTVGG